MNSLQVRSHKNDVRNMVIGICFIVRYKVATETYYRQHTLEHRTNYPRAIFTVTKKQLMICILNTVFYN